MAAVTEARPKKKTQRVRILEFICQFALENNGNSPSIRTIAASMGMGRTTVEHHLKTLRREGRIGWTEEQRVKVERSTWEPPEDVEI